MAINVDARMFEAQDAWEEYARKREWENPWDIEDEIMEKYRHRKQIGESSWEIEIEEPSAEDALRLAYNKLYKEKYIMRRDLFLFYQYKEWMNWNQIQMFIPQWCKAMFYPCDMADGQCSFECEWWPCINENRKTPEMEEVMSII